MQPTDFDGEDGAYHLNCSECGADAHIRGWNRFGDDSDAPEHCAYCGAESADYYDVSDREEGG